MLRLNDNGKHPNHLIYFISCHPNQSQQEKEKSTEILNRIAAIVYPVMKSQGLLVKSLKEHEYNSVFAGRNFNSGEVVELVLRDKRGNYVPEEFVLQVMLHELSHIKNMNHSGAFWKTLGIYKKEMWILLARGYTGEGFWSRGRKLTGTGDVNTWTGFDAQTVCGGA
jgi:DNA-dependent metalloprotease WSS1